MGLLDAPTSGRVLIESADSHDMRDAQRTNVRAQKIGFVFQQFHLISHLTAAENIQLRLAAAAIPRSLRRTLADEALERVGLTHRSDFFPYQLSGGEQQRVAIARGIAGSPLLLLCDEPSGNLDVANTQVVIDLLATLNAEGQTVLVVTHDMAVANWVDHIFEMSDGYLQT
jgi:putative ABC transport system ATP-binding protein